MTGRTVAKFCRTVKAEQRVKNGRSDQNEGRRRVDTPGDARRRTEMGMKRARLSDEKRSKGEAGKTGKLCL
jgi:hypothetical protein